MTGWLKRLLGGDDPPEVKPDDEKEAEVREAVADGAVVTSHAKRAIDEFRRLDDKARRAGKDSRAAAEKVIEAVEDR